MQPGKNEAEDRRRVTTWHPRALSKAEFHAVLREKRLSLSDAAFLWGVSTATACRLAANPARPAHWLFALAALPRLQATELRALRAERKRLQQSAQVTSRPEAQAAAVPSIELHESIACHALCGLAEEGDADGYLKGMRGIGADVEYLVCFPAGEDWFTSALFDHYFYATGRILAPEERR